MIAALLASPWIAIPWGIAKIVGRFLKSLPWPVWFGLALLAAFLLYGHARYEAGQAEVQVRWDVERAELARAADQARRDAKAARQARVARGRAILKQLRLETANAHAIRDRAIAGLRDGTFRLRSRFTCPPGTAAAGAGTTGGDAAAQAGLSRADAEFLVGFAGDADDVVRQLTACQAVVAADRAQLAMPSNRTAVADRD